MNAPVESKLLPCPFCGSGAHFESHGASDSCLARSILSCEACSASVESDWHYLVADASAEAITAWNTRTNQVAELVEARDSALWLLASILKAKDAFESDRSLAGVDHDAWDEQTRALIASHKGEKP